MRNTVQIAATLSVHLVSDPAKLPNRGPRFRLFELKPRSCGHRHTCFREMWECLKVRPDLCRFDIEEVGFGP